MPPFTVLHVCMGNICRSPMAERLLSQAVRERLDRRRDLAGSSGSGAAAAGDAAGGAELTELADRLLYSHSAGTGGWHEGEGMNPPAARQVRSRGADPTGFAARRLRSEHIDAADLILTATADQQSYVLALRPDAAARTFVLGEFGRLLPLVDAAALPAVAAAAATPTPPDAAPAPGDADAGAPDPVGAQAVYARGTALVAAVDAARRGAAPQPGDDLDDPWGRGDQCFERVADEIEETVHPLAAVLLP
ncbi:phosphotyrosine protein phosphatase [Plantactinospora sp. KBS50]|uniref:arsenate reductase/protein-tyrosine-phosphatase family protein n=1 Tax=Plantactinospora sp. KBS50 TaxID=2024580 RepID=UPI000BAAE4F6|nr:phosphotyrosine protein phosphatase [Plantactinospora sp. KBS50]ASW56458.1 phosphotyrosine protein phosphatase [Plantactinospora sp. KBS50]